MTTTTDPQLNTPAPEWTYLNHDEDGALLDGETRKLPERNTVFLVFDVFRWKVQVGVREEGGYMSILNPNIQDDCMVVAWAPFGTPTNVNEQMIKDHCFPVWHQAINENYASDGLKLAGYPPLSPPN